MQQCDFPVRIPMPQMRPLHDEHHGTKARNDANSQIPPDLAVKLHAIDIVEVV
jgi:hypothetical protein